MNGRRVKNMSEEVDRKSIEQYFIDYEKCWDDLKRFHKYMEMIAGNTRVFLR